jgi:hypothetical protein
MDWSPGPLKGMLVLRITLEEGARGLIATIIEVRDLSVPHETCRQTSDADEILALVGEFVDRFRVSGG